MFYQVFSIFQVFNIRSISWHTNKIYLFTYVYYSSVPTRQKTVLGTVISSPSHIFWQVDCLSKLTNGLIDWKWPCRGRFSILLEQTLWIRFNSRQTPIAGQAPVAPNLIFRHLLLGLLCYFITMRVRQHQMPQVIKLGTYFYNLLSRHFSFPDASIKFSFYDITCWGIGD